MVSKKYDITIFENVDNELYKEFSTYIRSRGAWKVLELGPGSVWRVSLSDEDIVYIILRYGETFYKRVREIDVRY